MFDPDHFKDYLSRLDLEALEDAPNKIDECEYFLALASAEPARDRFRWLVSAFLGAAYSYFEMSALRAHFAFTDESGQNHPDQESLNVLREYVGISQKVKDPGYVTTWGIHPTAAKLYEFRRGNTHHFPLSIMQSGPELPRDFHFGNMRGEGVAVLAFCRESLRLMRDVRARLDA